MLNLNITKLYRRVQISQPVKLLIFQLHQTQLRFILNKNIQNDLNQPQSLSVPLLHEPQRVAEALNRLLQLLFIRQINVNQIKPVLLCRVQAVIRNPDHIDVLLVQIRVQHLKRVQRTHFRESDLVEKDQHLFLDQIRVLLRQFLLNYFLLLLLRLFQDELYFVRTRLQVALVRFANHRCELLQQRVVRAANFELVDD